MCSICIWGQGNLSKFGFVIALYFPVSECNIYTWMCVLNDCRWMLLNNRNGYPEWSSLAAEEGSDVGIEKQRPNPLEPIHQSNRVTFQLNRYICIYNVMRLLLLTAFVRFCSCNLKDLLALCRVSSPPLFQFSAFHPQGKSARVNETRCVYRKFELMVAQIWNSFVFGVNWGDQLFTHLYNGSFYVLYMFNDTPTSDTVNTRADTYNQREKPSVVRAYCMRRTYQRRMGVYYVKWNIVLRHS